MKLVIAIDRDDDIGRKTSLKTPIIGRSHVLDAAIQLGTYDPEDSDLNTLFGAIKIYDTLISSGERAEIALVSGDENVGVISDSRIAEQVDLLKERFGAVEVILVTDGSEDEFVIPIIASRFRIDAVNRVVVKQSKSLESTYYLLKKMFEDPKIAKATLSPLGIILVIFSLFSLLGLRDIGYGMIVLFIGLYILLKAYGMDYAIEDYFSTIKKSLLEGRFSFVTYVVSLIFLIVGVIQGLNTVWKLFNSPVTAGGIYIINAFIYGSLWWIVASGAGIIVGRIFDGFIEGKPIKRYFAMFFLLCSAGLIIWGGAGFIISSTDPFSHLRENAMYNFMMSLFGAILLGIVGIIPLKYFGKEDSENV